MTHQPRVMVVDDDENILSAFEDFLRKENCQMVAETHVEEAFARFAEQRIDLLITDIRVRLHSGITLLLQVRAAYPYVPIIVITGHPDIITEKDVIKYGADFYFLKPLELDKLRFALKKCLRMTTK
ncbi:MAG: response regulator [Ignavibacteriales bacterium]|nr:response regulator [Ignavibacteriales bacterium]